MGEVKVPSYNVTHIPLVPCQLALPFPRYSIFKVWPWKSKVKVIAQGHKVGTTPYRLISLSYPFCSISIGPPIPEIQLFQNLTLKCQGQGHKCWQSWKSQRGFNIQSTHIPFFPCQSGIPFLSYDFFKIWPWNSRVKVMGEVTDQSYNVGLTSYRLTSLSFHVNQASHSWVRTFSKFDLENIRLKVIGEVTVRIHNMGLISYLLPDLTSFWPMGKPIWGKWANNYDVAQPHV